MPEAVAAAVPDVHNVKKPRPRRDFGHISAWEMLLWPRSRSGGDLGTLCMRRDTARLETTPATPSMRRSREAVRQPRAAPGKPCSPKPRRYIAPEPTALQSEPKIPRLILDSARREHLAPDPLQPL